MVGQQLFLLMLDFFLKNLRIELTTFRTSDKSFNILGYFTWGASAPFLRTFHFLFWATNFWIQRLEPGSNRRPQDLQGRLLTSWAIWSRNLYNVPWSFFMLSLVVGLQNSYSHLRMEPTSILRICDRPTDKSRIEGNVPKLNSQSQNLKEAQYHLVLFGQGYNHLITRILLFKSSPSIEPTTSNIWIKFSYSSAEIIFFLFSQAKELQTLHNLRKLFVQDLTTRVKKVHDLSLGCVHVNPFFMTTPAWRWTCGFGFSECWAGLWGGTWQRGSETEDLLPGEQLGTAHQGPQAGKVMKCCGVEVRRGKKNGSTITFVLVLE